MLGLSKEHFTSINNNYKPNYDAETDETHPEWCQYCTHFGEINCYNACADTPVFNLAVSQVIHTVSYTGRCDHFEYGKRLGGKAANPSLLKSLILKAHGFVYADQKTR